MECSMMLIELWNELGNMSVLSCREGLVKGGCATFEVCRGGSWSKYSFPFMTFGKFWVEIKRDSSI